MRKPIMAVLLFLALTVVGVSIGATVAIAQGENPLSPVDTFVSKLAARLGIGEDELRTAIADVQKEIIDEGLAEGRFSPGQAERLRERIDAGGVLPLGQRPHYRERPCQQLGRLVVGSAATVFGMTGEQLVAELQNDKTLAQVAEELGIDVEVFKVDLLDQIDQNLGTAVAEGKLTQAQADAIFHEIKEYIDRIVNGHFGPCHRPGDGPGHRLPLARLVVGSAATVFGMEGEQLVAELQNDKTLAQVAEELGIDVEVFKVDLLDQIDQNLGTAVAEGKLTQAQADAIFQQIQEHIDRIINHSRPG